MQSLRGFCTQTHHCAVRVRRQPGAASRAPETYGPPAWGYPMTLNLCVYPPYWKFEEMMMPGRSTFAYSSV